MTDTSRMPLANAWNAATGINTTLLTQETSGTVGRLGSLKTQTGSGGIADQITTALKQYLDQDMKGGDPSRQMSLDGGVSQYYGVPQTTRSLPHILNGTARIIRAKVATTTATRADPIKVIMALQIVDESKVIVITPIVTGGGAQITPERASAKLISTSATQKEFFLARYGVDVSMNLNGVHQPKVFADELRVKLDHQRQNMEDALVGLTYNVVLEEGTSLSQAMLRGDPIKGTLKEKRRLIEADRLHAALALTVNKDVYPIPNMIACLSAAGVYTPIGGHHSANAVLLVPPGMLTLSKFTRKSEMYFNVSGVPLPVNEDSLRIPLTNVREDRDYGLRILTHFPPLNTSEYGTYNPQVTKNELAGELGISMYYEVPTGGGSITITDFKERSFKKLTPDSVDQDVRLQSAARDFVNHRTVPGTMYSRVVDEIRAKNDGLYSSVTYGNNSYDESDSEHIKIMDDMKTQSVFFYLRVNMRLHTASAIYCTNPGKDTGIMMISAPQTGVCIDRSTEELKIPMRMYMGAGVIAPENIVILNDVQCLGVLSGHGTKTPPTTLTTLSELDAGNPRIGGVKYVPYSEDTDDETDLVLCMKYKSTSYTELFNDYLFVHSCKILGIHGQVIQYTKTRHDYYGVSPLLPYAGAVFADDVSHTVIVRNNGHLEGLDHPNKVDRLNNRQHFSDD